MDRVVRNQDIAGGLIIVALAVGFLYFGMNLRFGQASAMGPGFLPRLLGTAMVLLGGAIFVRGLLRATPPAEWPSWRATFIVVLCPIVFGILVPLFGLALSTVLTALFSRLAQKARWRWSVLVTAVAISIFNCVVFVYLLKLPIKLWP
jgi:cell division protein FtsW (lipid II flippase)